MGLRLFQTLEYVEFRKTRENRIVHINLIVFHCYLFNISVEAVHLANLLCQFGYYFPIGELKNLLVKDDSSLYRFQSPYYWPSQHHTPDNIEYAIYLAKR